MKVIVLTSSEEEIELDVTAKDTFADLKVKIKDETAIEPENQSLFCLGYLISDDQAKVKDFTDIVKRQGCLSDIIIAVFPLVAWDTVLDHEDLSTDLQTFVLSRGDKIQTILGRTGEEIDLTDVEDKNTIHNGHFGILYQTKTNDPRSYALDIYNSDKKTKTVVITKDKSSSCNQRIVSDGSAELQRENNFEFKCLSSKSSSENFVRFINFITKALSDKKGQIEINITTSTLEPYKKEVNCNYTLAKVVEDIQNQHWDQSCHQRLPVYLQGFEINQLCAQMSMCKLQHDLTRHKVSLHMHAMLIAANASVPQDKSKKHHQLFLIRQTSSKEDFLVPISIGVEQHLILETPHFGITEPISPDDSIGTQKVTKYSTGGKTGPVIVKIKQDKPKKYKVSWAPDKGPTSGLTFKKVEDSGSKNIPTRETKNDSIGKRIAVFTTNALNYIQ